MTADPTGSAAIGSPDALVRLLDAQDYLADEGTATAAYLALRMGRPLFLEGEPGVGKTELAKAMAAVLGTRPIRLQCYEGIDAAQALYDWDYPRQLLHLRAAQAAGVHDTAELERGLYDRRFLLERPLLRALGDGADSAALDGSVPAVPAEPAEPTEPTEPTEPAEPAEPAVPSVLLVDEVDRADDEFEAFLLEFLSDFQVSIPEFGTVRATTPPVVILTSNRTREVHDALKRRCLYHWMAHPDFEREVAIIRRRLPDTSEALAKEVAATVQRLRGPADNGVELLKPPGVAESIDWAQALAAVGARSLDVDSAARTLGALLKHVEDHETVRSRLSVLLDDSDTSAVGG